MITIKDEGAALATAEILKSISEEKLRQLAFASERYVFQDGDVIMQQGEEGEHAFMILTGVVVISIKQGDVVRELATLDQSYLLGDHALVSGDTYKVTVRAKGPVEALRIHRDNFLQMLDGDKEAMSGMMKALARRKAVIEEMFDLKFD